MTEDVNVVFVRVTLSGMDARVESTGMYSRRVTTANTAFTSGKNQRLILRSRRELLITDTELKLMAAAATIGDSIHPNHG